MRSLAEIYERRPSGGWELPRSDNEYLKYYCKYLLLLVSELVESDTFELARLIDVKFETIQVDKVAATIRSYLPMTSSVALSIERTLSQSAISGAP
jgi:hypothetical protein